MLPVGAKWAHVSIPWAPPEAHTGDRTARKSYDVWAWGCFLYECLEGGAPWWTLKAEQGCESAAAWMSLRVWETDADDRPPMTQIVRELLLFPVEFIAACRRDVADMVVK
eukprot:gene55183-52434_t